MTTFKPIVLCISGFDPCGGAGMLADCKTVEQLGGYCMGVVSSNTIQTESIFIENCWTDTNFLLKQLDTIIEKYPIAVCKIGIIQSVGVLEQIADRLNALPNNIPIIWDPVLSASAGFSFHGSGELDVMRILSKITCVTPNAPEAQTLFNHLNLAEVAAQTTCAILLKGGHGNSSLATDTLYQGADKFEFSQSRSQYTKHGTGCIVSSAIATFLALGESLPNACKQAQGYVSGYINSHSSLLGYHGSVISNIDLEKKQ